MAEIADRLTDAGRPPAGTTVSVARMYADGRAEYRVRGSFPVSVTDDLGFARPPGHEVERPEEPFVQISPEQVDRLDADLLFLAVDPGAGETVSSDTQHNPLWPRLEVSRAGQVHQVDTGHWIFGSILAADEILTDLDRLLLGG